jgi:glycine betaine/proline transport system ATP-binding protein
VALQDVSFDVHDGETFVVMGLSGSGKSTLVRCINRLINPTTGSVFVDDDDVLAFGDEELTNFRRTKTSMVFQQFGLLPHRTVLENTAWGLEIQDVPLESRSERAQEVLELVGLLFGLHVGAVRSDAGLGFIVDQVSAAPVFVI